MLLQSGQRSLIGISTARIDVQKVAVVMDTIMTHYKFQNLIPDQSNLHSDPQNSYSAKTAIGSPPIQGQALTTPIEALFICKQCHIVYVQRQFNRAEPAR
jgi:hypothetical protein